MKWLDLNWLFGNQIRTKVDQKNREVEQKRQATYEALLAHRFETAEREGNETLKTQLEQERKDMQGR